MTLLERGETLLRMIRTWEAHKAFTADLIHEAKQELTALMDRARQRDGWEATL